jgi:sugar-specific transcriptional regulator TrmB
LNSGERIETLTSLGLTLNQARAYLSLAQLGPIGAKELAEASKITRQDIYRVMLALEEKGIAEKLLLMPTVYRALPIEQVTAKLLDSKMAEQKALRRKTRQLVADVRNSNQSRLAQDDASEFIVIPGKEAIIQRLGNALSRTCRSLDVVTSRERFSPAILEFSKGYEKALERGVKIRIAVEKHLPQNGALETTRTLGKIKNFEVRFISRPAEAIVSVFDSKEASVTISSTANYAKASALWSNDAGFVALARNYFENMWNNGAELTE